MKAKIRWVRGNEVLLKVNVTKRDDDGVFQPVDIDGLDEWKLAVVTMDTPCGCPRAVRPKAYAGENTGEVVANITADFPCGTYGIEFMGKKDGVPFRAYESSMFGIVERNGKASIIFEPVEGEKSVDVNLEVQLMTNAVVREENVYEEWKKIPGNENKTLDDFLDTIQHVQSDWSVTDPSEPAFIKNKPTQAQSDWSQTDTTAVDYIKNKPELSAVAASGDYADLSNKPIKGVIDSSWIDSWTAVLDDGVYVVSDRPGVLVCSSYEADGTLFRVETLLDDGYVRTRKKEDEALWYEWAEKDNTLVHWVFEQGRKINHGLPVLVWATGGHRYSELYDNWLAGRTLLVTMRLLNRDYTICKYNHSGDTLEPITNGNFGDGFIYHLSDDGSDGIEVEPRYIHPSIRQAVFEEDSGDVVWAEIIGEDIISDEVVTVAKLTVDADGVSITTSEGAIATYNDEEIATMADIPENTDTHRPIQVNGTQVLGDNVTPLNLKAGSNVTLTNSGGEVTISSTGGGASAFIAEYGVTTYADVKAAYDEDAVIICTVGDSGNTVVLQLAYFDDANDTFCFAQPVSEGSYWVNISSNDTWNDGYFQFASTDTATQLRDGLMSALDWQKLDGIESGAEVNVQSDWNQTTTTAKDYIKNKPTIPDVTGKADKVSSATNGHLAGLNASGNLTDSGIAPSTLVYQGASQGTVPSVDFDPETDTVHVTAQTLSSSQQAQARANIGAGTSSFSGSYNDLTNKPTIPDAVSGTNDGTNWTSITIGSTTKAIPSGGGGGEANVIESISINGTTQTVTSKNVDLPVPTSTAVTQIVSISQAAYDLLDPPSSTTLYLITS